MRTGTLVSAARHMVPVPKCSVLNKVHIKYEKAPRFVSAGLFDL